MTPTEKQIKYVQRIVDYLGVERVVNYIEHFYPAVDINNLKKDEVQKIITGLSSRLPRKHYGGNGMSMSWIQSQ